MILHADPNNPYDGLANDVFAGWVADNWDVPIHGSPSAPVQDYIQWAFEHTGTKDIPNLIYGRVILMKAGRYGPFVFQPDGSGNYLIHTVGSDASNPVIVQGEPGTIIGPETTFGTSTMQVVGRDSTHPFNYIQWYGVKWECGNKQAAIKIGACPDLLTSPITSYKGWRFKDCEIDGLFDHTTQQSSVKNQAPGTYHSEWGLCSWSLDDFQWIGGSVHDIEQEHAFYLRSSQGDITITEVDIWEVGRTAVQVVARVIEAGCNFLPENPGNITITNNTIRDVGLWDADPVDPNVSGDYHAGTAITITGGQRGVTVISGNSIKYGFNLTLKNAILSQPDYPAGVPYGSGAIIVWSASGKDTDPVTGLIHTCAEVRVSVNTVSYASDSGDRVAVQLCNIDDLRCSNNSITTGARPFALWLGDLNLPNDEQYTVPATYCVKDNVLTNGSFDIADGTCTQCTQPRGNCVIGGQSQ